MEKKILLTGRPGIGKTTVCRRVVDRLERSVRGFLTEEIREAGKRRGFRLKTFSGRKAVLSHVNFEKPRVGKYGVKLKTMREVANPELEAALESGAQAPLVVDEIGKMELKDEKFKHLVREALQAPNPLLATVPSRGPKFVEELKASQGVKIKVVTKENREVLPANLVGSCF